MASPPKSKTPLCKPADQRFLFADPASSDFIPEYQRFQGKAFELERANRQQQFLKKQEMLQQKREARLKDYHSRRWQVEEEHNKQLNKLKVRAAGWKQGMKNNASEAYNPITLEYDTTEQGLQLKYRDDLKQRRSQMRMDNLDSRQNSGHNPITGQPRAYHPIV